MAVDPSVRIDLAATFTGKKAFKQADTATQKLTKNVKSLAKTFGVAYGTAQVLAFAKASVRAAAADKKAQQQLAIALKNVGLGRDAASAEGYIQRLQTEFAVLDDELRPAYAKLAIATKDTAETQRLLAISLDVSKSTGKDLDAVTSALSKAYLGNNTALSKLGVGISKADLKSKSFKDITDKLAATFAGAAKASADSFSGSIDRLAIASNNAKEIIGTSLIGALQSLGENDSMATLSSNIESAASSLANFIDSVVYLKEQIKSIPGAGIFGYLFSGVTDLLGRFSPQRLAELVKQIKGFQGMGNVAMTGGSNMDTQKSTAKAIAANKKLTATKINADKLAAANADKLKKSAAIFDIQQIQIAAALKGKISEEERIRLLLMQAIADEDVKKAETLTKKLEDIQAKNAKIAADLLAIGQAEDPFSTWAGSLSLALAALSKLGLGMSAISSIMIPGVTYNPTQNADRNYDDKVAAAKALAEKAATEKAAADKAAADANAAAVLAAAGDKAAADKAAAADAAAAAAAILAGSGTTFNSSQNADRNYDDALAAAAAALATAPTNGSPGAGVTYNPTQNADRNYTDANATQTPSIVINVEGSVLNGDDFDEIVSRAMLNNIRRGLSQNPAGVIT